MANQKKKLYSWEGKDKNKNAQQGEIFAQSLVMAKMALHKKGITPTKIRKKNLSINFLTSKPIKHLDIVYFTRQMATMIKAGVPLIQCFDIVIEGIEKPLLKNLLDSIKKDIEGGNTLAEALEKHPKYFDALYCNLIGIGEQSGTLDVLLNRIASYKEKTESLKLKVKKALRYPIIVVIVSFLVTGILLIKVVPQFEEIFKGFGADLPAFTQMVINLSSLVQSGWITILLSSLVFFIGMKFLIKKVESIKNKYDILLLKLPVFGQIITKSTIARLTRTLSTTFAAGVPLTEALVSIKGAANNFVYRTATESIRKDVSGGQTLQTAMKNSKQFPNLAVQMVAAGEESGTLDDMLSKVASYYEEEVENLVDGLTSMLEPMIMIVLGILVGGLIIAMYLPIFELGSVV